MEEVEFEVERLNLIPVLWSIAATKKPLTASRNFVLSPWTLSNYFGMQETENN